MHRLFESGFTLIAEDIAICLPKYCHDVITEFTEQLVLFLFSPITFLTLSLSYSAEYP